MRNRFFSSIFAVTMLFSAARADVAESYYAGVNPDAEMVFIADLESLLASPLVMAVQQMMQQFSPSENPKALAMGLTEFTGATTDDLGRFVVSTSDVALLQQMNGAEEMSKEQINQSGMIMAFQLNKGISKEQFQAWVESITAPDEMAKTEKKAVGNGVVYQSPDANGMTVGFLPSTGQTMIFVGGDVAVTKALTDEKGTLPKSIAVAQSLVPSMPNIALLASPSEAWKADLIKQAEENMEDEGEAAYIKDAEQFTFGLNISDGIKILSGMKFQSADTAKSAYTNLNETVTELKAMPMEQGPMMMLMPFITRLQVAENGDTISLDTEMSAVESQQMLMMLPMLMMQQMQGGMEMEVEEEEVIVPDNSGM
ncbi:hypothetical protein [Cerasicoccus arenae]|nr:hypothetical protein [Cerasicoccus arenae]